MAITRSQTEERQYKRRGKGVMRKADKVHILVRNIKAAVLFLDGNNLWTYESEEGWVSLIPSMANIRVERMDPSQLRTVFEQQQAVTQTLPPIEAEPALGVGQSLPDLEPSLFVSTSMLEISPPSTPSANVTRRQLRSGTSVGQPCETLSPTRSRRLARPRAARRTRNAREGTRSVEDIYGFGAIGDDAE